MQNSVSEIGRPTFNGKSSLKSESTVHEFRKLFPFAKDITWKELLARVMIKNQRISSQSLFSNNAKKIINFKQIY